MPGTKCFAVGYPDDLTQQFAHPPAMGEGAAEDSTFVWHVGGPHLLRLKANRPYPAELDGPSGFDTGGMSGGGVFDLEGKLVAILKGGNDKDGAFSVRIETVRAQWNMLRHGRYLYQADKSNLAQRGAELSRKIEPIRRSIVTILNGDKAVAYGTLINTNGQIVTRAGILPASPLCRLYDGRIVRAKVLRVSAEKDLAILEIAESSRLAIRLGPYDKDPSIGEAVAFPEFGDTMQTGYVSSSVRFAASIPSDNRSHGTSFSNVFYVGANVNSELPGGPLLDASGQMRGMVLASPSSGWLTVLPLSLVISFLDDLN